MIMTLHSVLHKPNSRASTVPLIISVIMCLQFRAVLTTNCFYFTQLFLLKGVLSYNIDTDTVRLFSDPRGPDHRRGSYFGFSVALYASGSDFAVLVGAPRANSSEITDAIEPGSVYRCSPDSKCKEWILERNRGFQSFNEMKHNAWIGATMAIENRTHPAITVCAPRWKQIITRENKQHWFMNGLCYSTIVNEMNSFDNEAQNRFSPITNIRQQIISTNGVGIFNFGMGQAGFSLHVTSNEIRSDLVLGSPGIYNWKGSPLLISKTFDGNRQIVVPRIGDESRIRSSDYLGYAVTSGCYFQKNDMWFASGAPRSADIHGSVLIFTFPERPNGRLSIKSLVQGEQHGEYFGASLASCDLNNDGRDELIVGAPLWSQEMDEGRVYIFSARFNEHMEAQSYNGEGPGGRFGSTLMCLGDIDYDGYADFAVGAPYEDDAGAVYIFNGHSSEAGKKYSQKIMGSRFGQGVRGFGVSIAEPRDVNGDQYPDLAIGAYLSEQVILLRSMPVVSINTSLAPGTKKRLLRNSTVVLVELCAAFEGAYAPSSLQVIKLLKVDPMYGRATYNGEKAGDNTYKLPDTLKKSETLCERLNINLKDNIQNVIDPIEIHASVVVVQPKKSGTKESLRTDSSFKCESCAVVNKLSSQAESLIKLPFALDCGDDDICMSDVKLTLASDLPTNNAYIIGSTPSIKLTVHLSNSGEPAYQSKVYVYIPDILSLASIPPACMEDSRSHGTLQVICDTGNPLRNNQTLTLEVDMSEVRFDRDSIKISASVTTQSEEKNKHDDSQALIMHLDVDVDVTIAGKALEDLYSYDEQKSDEIVKSIRFQHIFEVQKFGASPVEEAVLRVEVPNYWNGPSGDLAIISINQTNGYIDGQPFFCEVSDSAESLTLLPYKTRSLTSPLPEHSYDKLMEEEVTAINLPAANRSLFINCTNPNIKCKTLQCKLGPLASSLSVAKLTLTLDLQLLNLKSIMDEKDIVYFISEGSVSITQSRNVVQRPGHKPDRCSVATMFVGSPIAQHVALWILILSVFLGIILLVLLALGLIKLGFFNRKKKEELEALKAESDRSNDTVLETTSSQQVLNED